MSQTIDELIRRIRELQEELEEEYRRRRESFEFFIQDRRIRFAEEVARGHRRLRSGLLGYVLHARPLVVLVAPLIYAGILPFAALDLFLAAYQAVCFPVYGIPRVRRSDYLVWDRSELSYLNALEKLNCAYCAYANGVAALAREVAARTEQYWCPIKHARRIRAAHERYPRFFEFGDAESYARGLERLRKELEEERPVPPDRG